MFDVCILLWNGSKKALWPAEEKEEFEFKCAAVHAIICVKQLKVIH